MKKLLFAMVGVALVFSMFGACQLAVAEEPFDGVCDVHLYMADGSTAAVLPIHIVSVVRVFTGGSIVTTVNNQVYTVQNDYLTLLYEKNTMIKKCFSSLSK